MEANDRDILKNVVEAIIKTNGIEDFNSIPQNIIDYMIDIEKHFQWCEEHFHTIKTELKKINLSYRGITSGARVSWSTFNRYDILKKYIDYRMNSLECNKELVCSQKLNSLKAKNKQLEDELEQIVDISLEIGLLQDKIKSLEIMNQNLTVEKNLWLAEKQEIYKKLSNYKITSDSTVTNIKSYKQIDN